MNYLIQGLPGHDPARPRRGGVRRRRDAEPDVPKIILPLATPAIAVTGFLGFLGGWSEYLTVYYFIGGQVPDWTLSIALNSMVGQFARNTPWSDFAAFAILFALPVSVVFFFFQRYLVGGLAVGGVKG